MLGISDALPMRLVKDLQYKAMLSRFQELSIDFPLLGLGCNSIVTGYAVNYNVTSSAGDKTAIDKVDNTTRKNE